MNNQKGEAILFCVLILVVLSGLLTLCGLELQRNFSSMKKRTNLFLCVKESKGEFNNYMTLMGRTNWALKNISKAQMVAAFIPGLQGAALEADKLKRALKAIQQVSLAAYVAKIIELKKKDCPLDPQMVLTPFLFTGAQYKRGLDDVALLRRSTWTYFYFEKPYLLTLKVDASHFQRISPQIIYQAEEKGATLSSLLSSR
jgi:hypothetical protein